MKTYILSDSAYMSSILAMLIT